MKGGAKRPALRRTEGEIRPRAEEEGGAVGITKGINLEQQRNNARITQGMTQHPTPNTEMPVFHELAGVSETAK